MSLRHKEWARKARAALMRELGNGCAGCGVTAAELARRGDRRRRYSRVVLEFDCIEPRGHRHHRGSTDQRMCFYRKEHAKKNVQILCTVCNARKGNLQDKQALKDAYNCEPY